MAEPQLTNPIESIKCTLNTFDSKGRGILIGTAAIHWFLASRDCDTVDIPLRDVDIFTNDAGLEVIQQDIDPATAEMVTRTNKRLTVVPSEETRRLGICTLDALSDSDSYDDPLVRTKFNGRIYAKDNINRELVREYEGVRYLHFPFICWWKTAVGRDSDIATVQKAIFTLCENNAVWSNEITELKLALRRGEAGEDITGTFIYSDDPVERKEQLAERKPGSYY